MVWHNDQHGRLAGSEDGLAWQFARPVGKESAGAGITVSTAGGSGALMVRYNGQHSMLIGSEQGPAYRSARRIENE